MAACRWLLIVLCTFASLAQASTPVPGKIVLASEEWNDYTNKDGSGLAWDLLRQVFEPADIAVHTRSVPYTRSIGLAQRGEVDGCVGTYREEASGVLYPRWNFDADHVYALGLATAPTPTLATLGKYRLAWVRGYKYEGTCPTCSALTRSSGAAAFCRCCNTAVPISISMPLPKPNTCSLSPKTRRNSSSRISLSCRST